MMPLSAPMISTLEAIAKSPSDARYSKRRQVVALESRKLIMICEGYRPVLTMEGQDELEQRGLWPVSLNGGNSE